MRAELEVIRKKVAATPKNSAGQRKFSKELRDQVVEYASYSGESLSAIGNQIGIHPLTVHSWTKKHQQSFAKFQVRFF